MKPMFDEIGTSSYYIVKTMRNSTGGLPAGSSFPKVDATVQKALPHVGAFWNDSKPSRKLHRRENPLNAWVPAHENVKEIDGVIQCLEMSWQPSR